VKTAIRLMNLLLRVCIICRLTTTKLARSVVQPTFMMHTSAQGVENPLMLNAGLKALCVQDVIHSILPQSMKFALVGQRRSALAVDAQTVVGWRYTNDSRREKTQVSGCAAWG